jgi:hypothetical protein
MNFVHKPRRGVGISLRFLIVVVLACGLESAAFVMRAREKRDSVAAIRKAGGSLKYDYEFVDSKQIANGHPREPAWVQDLLDQNYMHDVTWVNLCAINPNNVDLRFLRAFRSLEELYADLLPGSAALLHVKGLSDHLRVLHINEPGFDDAELAHIARLAKLEDLSLCGANVTDSGMRCLKLLGHLRRLTFTRPARITGCGLRQLQGLPISQLRLYDTGLTDEGAAALACFPKLSDLVLWRQKLTDAGLVHIGKLRQLQNLDLYESRVSDAGLVHLRGLSSLRVLQVRGTLVTEAGAAEFQKGLPNVRIFRAHLSTAADHAY